MRHEDTSAESTESSTEVTVVSVATSSSAELQEGSGDDPPDPLPPKIVESDKVFIIQLLIDTKDFD